jgi:hypothetical protein
MEWKDALAGREHRPALQAGHGFKKPDDLVGAQNDRQLARRSSVGNALRHCRRIERDSVENPQRADNLVELTLGQRCLSRKRDIGVMRRPNETGSVYFFALHRCSDHLGNFFVDGPIG